MRVKWSQRWSLAACWSSSAERPVVGIVMRAILRPCTAAVDGECSAYNGAGERTGEEHDGADAARKQGAGRDLRRRRGGGAEGAGRAGAGGTDDPARALEAGGRGGRRGRGRKHGGEGGTRCHEGNLAADRRRRRRARRPHGRPSAQAGG